MATTNGLPCDILTCQSQATTRVRLAWHVPNEDQSLGYWRRAERNYCDPCATAKRDEFIYPTDTFCVLGAPRDEEDTPAHR